jgi:hypothetical protein
MHADARGGEFTTHPLKCPGGRLRLNFATSATGFIKVEAIDDQDKVLEKSAEIFGDEFETAVLDTSRLAGSTFRLRFVMKDADLYALRFAD